MRYSRNQSRIEEANKLLEEIEEFMEQTGIEFSEALEIYKIIAIREVLEDFPEEICIRH